MAAYLGGPVRVQVLGYDPTEAKVYFSQQAYDETGSPREIYYFDLNTQALPQPVHAVSLDVPVDSLTTGAGARRLTQIQQRLIPLRELRNIEFGVTVEAESTGVTAEANHVQFALHVKVETTGSRGTVALKGSCRPTVGVRDLYRIAGRTEALAVLLYIGRDYGCEEVELPILLRGAGD